MAELKTKLNDASVDDFLNGFSETNTQRLLCDLEDDETGDQG